MTQIRALDLTNDFLTSKGGLTIGKKIEGLLRNNPAEIIEVSFDGVQDVAPSFVNGAFLYLIDNYGDDYFRSRVKVVHSTSDVAKTISSSVKSYIDHQKLFYSKLRTDKVFIVVDSSEFGRKFTQSLRDISLQKGFQVLSNPTLPDFTDQTRTAIQQSDVVVGILAHGKSPDMFSREFEFAANCGKQIIILQDRSLNDRISSSLRDRVQIFYFDEVDFLDQLGKLNQLVYRYRNQLTHSNNKQQPAPDSVATAIIAVLVLGIFVALFFALMEESGKKKS